MFVVHPRKAEANARNYRIVSKEKVAALAARQSAVKAKKIAQKQTQLLINKGESIRELKRERNVAQARQVQLELERAESVSQLVFERARYNKL